MVAGKPYSGCGSSLVVPSVLLSSPELELPELELLSVVVPEPSKSVVSGTPYAG